MPFLYRYSDGHIYIGHWRSSQRSGFGRMEETSRRNSLYTGSWEADRRNGYGVYEDKMRYIMCVSNMIITGVGDLEYPPPDLCFPLP